MNRSDIINELKPYFKPYELVSEAVYKKMGDDSWSCFRTETLLCLLIMRVGIDKPFHINNWYWGGNFDERGYRENISDIVKRKTGLYLSGHVLGAAIDFHINGMSSDLVREWIVENEDMFPCKIRLEEKDAKGNPISWVHFDTIDYAKNPKVYLFDA